MPLRYITLLLAALGAHAFCVDAIPLQAQDAEQVGPPTVHPDGRVTFRRHAPAAERVVLVLEGAPPSPMTRGEDGHWTLTTAPLSPDLFAYHFFIDGVAAGDPANPAVKPVISGGGQGLVHVPGPDSLVWERGEEQQGTIEHLEYESKLIGERRRLIVYLPPSYQQPGSASYPVLYLLHGIMDDESAWTTAGRANVILDNLFESRLAEPMLVVMPLGYGFSNPAEHAGDLLGAMDHREWMEVFASSLMSEVVPFVEAEYSVRAGQGSRAIAGLSMGGAQALFIGLTRPGSFGWVGSMSGAFMMYGGDFDSWLGNANTTSASDLPTLWLSTGDQDFVRGSNRQLVEWLEVNGFPAEYRETPGAHTWSVWRRALAEFVPRLFRPR